MFGVLKSIVGPVAGLASSYIEGKTAVQKAKATKDLKIATGEIDWDIEAMKATQSSWKDEWLTVVFTLPLILLLFGEEERVNNFFLALSNCPEWYQYLLGTIVAASFGFRGAAKFMGKKK